MNKIAYGCVAVSWLFAVPLSYTYIEKNSFKWSAVEGTCRIVNMKLWDEREGQCEEKWSGETVWDKPCKVDVEVSHKGYVQPTDNNGIKDTDNTGTWMHLLTYQCKPGTPGQSCVDLMNTRDNDFFTCSYIPYSEPPHFSVVGNKMYAAEKTDLGASDHLFWSMVVAWVLGPVCAFCIVFNGEYLNKSSKRALLPKDEEQYMVEYDEESDEE